MGERSNFDVVTIHHSPFSRKEISFLRSHLALIYLMGTRQAETPRYLLTVSPFSSNLPLMFLPFAPPHFILSSSFLFVHSPFMALPS